MRRIRKIIIWILSIATVLYLLLCGAMYFLQEKLIFHPHKIETAFKYNYIHPFEELSIPVSDHVKLNALLFKADSSKGLIFYLHGNAGALDTWGGAAENYLKRGYDFFILDYRGFGKSEGEIYSEQQFFEDVQSAYNTVKKNYPENKVTIIGYSIGTCSAAMLAARNAPACLILQAPYYSLTDMMHHTYPFAPDLLLKYKFKTYEFLSLVKCPVYIFHGDADEIIYYGSSLKLKENFKKSDSLFTLPGAGHLGMNRNVQYLEQLAKILP